MGKSLWKWDKFEKWKVLKCRTAPVFSASQCFHLDYNYDFRKAAKEILKYNVKKKIMIIVDYPQTYQKKEGESFMQVDVFFKGELNKSILLKIEEIVKNETVK